MTTQRSAGGGTADLRDGLVAYADHDLDQAIASLQEARQVLAQVDLDSLPHPWREQGQKLEALCGGEPR